MDALKRKVKKVWKELDQQSFRKLLAKYREMLQTVFDAEGGLFLTEGHSFVPVYKPKGREHDCAGLTSPHK